MKKTLLIFSLILVSIILIAGCGQTNYLGWTKSADSGNVSTLDKARQYVDNAEYTKAESLLNDYMKNHASDREANILYGQVQMGLADVDISTAIRELSASTPTASILKLDKVCTASDRQRIFDAADKFITYPPSKSSDKLIAALCGMIAWTEQISLKFDTNNLGIDASTTFAGGANVSATWAAVNNNYLTTLAIGNLSSLSGNKDLADSASSMNTVITLANAAGGGLTWAPLKTALLSF